MSVEVTNNNALEVFTNEEFGSIRSLIIDNEPWFVGKDIAEVLGYKNTKDAIQTHVDEEDKRIVHRSQKSTLENHIPKDVLPAEFVSADIPNRGLTAINESGLYSLILGSKLPNAKKFKRWVTSEVLPTIRKKGYYVDKGMIRNEIIDPTIPLTNEECAAYYTVFMDNFMNGLKEFGTSLISAVDKRVEIVEKNCGVLQSGYNTMCEAFKVSEDRANKLESTLNKTMRMMTSNMVSVVTDKNPKNQNSKLSNTLPYNKTQDWLKNAWKSAEIIGKCSGYSSKYTMKQLFTVMRANGVDVDGLYNEYSASHPDKVKINMVAESDYLRPLAEAAFHELHRKYLNKLFNGSEKDEIKNNDNKTTVKETATSQTTVKAESSVPAKKVYKSQLLLSTPAEVKVFLEAIAKKNGWNLSYAAAHTYKEIEKRTNKNLKELSGKYAEKFGYTNCSKAYYISKSKMLMEVLKNISEGN